MHWCAVCFLFQQGKLSKCAIVFLCVDLGAVVTANKCPLWGLAAMHKPPTAPSRLIVVLHFNLFPTLFFLSSSCRIAKSSSVYMTRSRGAIKWGRSPH